MLLLEKTSISGIYRVYTEYKKYAFIFESHYDVVFD